MSRYAPCPVEGCSNLKWRSSRRCQRCMWIDRARRGAGNPGWKGGRIKSNGGYVKRWAPEHPRAQAKGYVLEHILVMEQRLGRHLLLGETVHHKNGVRNDNRPENLELWVTRQPAGQRPEDLVAWAREILDRYGDDRCG